MRVLRCSGRLVCIFFLTIAAIVIASVVLGKNPAKRNDREWRIINRWMGCFNRLLGLHIHVSGEKAVTTSLLLCNHISWHDIIVLQSLVATGFVGKHEIRKWPLIGWLAYQGNTLFIHRGKRESFEQTQKAIRERLAANQNIVLFPEGTTTNGDAVKPFRSRLLEPAISLSLPVQPVTIWYRGSSLSCAELSFIGDEGLLSHALRTLGETRIDVYVHFSKPLATDKNVDQRELGRRAHDIVAKQLDNFKQSY